MNALLPYFRYLKGKWKMFVLALLCGLIYGVSSGAGIPIIFEKVFKQIFESDTVYTQNQVILLALAVPAVFLMRGLFSFCNQFLMNVCALHILKGLREAVFNKIQDLPMGYFDKNRTGDVLSRVHSDPMAVQVVLLEVAAEFFSQPIQVISALSGLVYLSLQNNTGMFLLFFGVTLPVCIIPTRIIKRKIKKISRSAHNAAGDMTQCISENLGAAAEVRSFNLQGREKKNFASRILAYVQLETRMVKYQKLQQPMMELIGAGLIASVFVFAYFSGIPFSVFSAMGLALYFAIDPLKRLANVMGNVHKAHGAIQRINEVLDMPVGIADSPDAKPLERLTGAVRYQNVSFAYDEADVLHEMGFEIAPGTQCALVGPSGSGKSTVTKLLPRFYDVAGGAVEIDGVDIRTMRLEDLRRNIAIVPQQPVLFNDTVMNNIALGNAHASEEEIQQAAKNAFAHDFIIELDGGYGAIVGDRGDRLSGGQKQRIAIARAFLKNAPVLILDEATSALDTESEHYIQQAIQKLAQNKTVIIIAHRLSTIKNAEKILVFNEGKIVAEGSHDGLYQESALYKNLVDRQQLG